MTNAQLEIQIILSLVAVACALPGVFLVLRKMALISDAISHSILPGIVIGFFITQDLASPLLILMATLTGVLTVVLVEYIQKTGLVKEDTAIGLVFPALFSLGVILIARNAGDVHLDVDAVLLGEVAFAPFDRWMYNGIDMGPRSLWMIGTILSVSMIMLILFYKELKIATFDAGLAASLGFTPIGIHYGLMTVSSVTTVGAFDAIGAILVVAFMIVPAACVYLLTTNLKKMLVGSSLVGIFASITGYWLAHALDTSIAGTIATVLGLLFFMVYLFAPNKGYISQWYKTKQQKTEVAMLVFMLHLANHEDERERNINHLQEHINWSKQRAKKVLRLAYQNNMIEVKDEVINLTEKGLAFTEKAISYISDNKNSELEGIKQNFFLFRG
ncbi:metal ABC transporter permease [Wenyingzhuangia marina]|uniref:Manganese/zinc/iron transport system permease protein n=1 Tax=Wenyingzhuangia marina TaxID=1195760 RepID=A0A1M5T3G2_9FLAO|nr:metal ABC transporter permease [Wenyingzhuangia marina]GGF65257.1 zinc ABC transporter permease [Wenyingzhuangia marina]SHH45281.1 manganese/zinc/iron transport system permease protein [Wenyingzhuangia marina]